MALGNSFNYCSFSFALLDGLPASSSIALSCPLSLKIVFGVFQKLLIMLATFGGRAAFQPATVVLHTSGLCHDCWQLIYGNSRGQNIHCLGCTHMCLLINYLPPQSVAHLPIKFTHFWSKNLCYQSVLLQSLRF